MHARNATISHNEYGIPVILATKLFVPQLATGLVPHPALVERVRLGLARPLTLIAAPAGFGKTTVLTQALADDRTVAWLALDPEDDAPARFWLYVAAALERALPGLGAAALARMQETPAPDGQELAATLLNAAAALPADRRVVLALDDYHLITAPIIQQQMSFLLDHLPPQLRIAILTRADPPLALPRRRARGELSEVRAADLRFPAADIGRFFQQALGRALAPEAIAALDQRTEGWVAGLKLAALALESVADADDDAARLAGLLDAERNLLDYLADEVLAGLDADLHTFLLRTAILDRLNGALCAEILKLEETEAAAYLRRIERAGLFLVALDPGGDWYRYHHLFADLLRIRLQREVPASVIADLHRAAAAWHTAHGSVDTAIDHALQAQAPDLAAAAIEARYLTAVRQIDGAALTAWLAHLPAHLIDTRPRLILADAWRALLELDLPALERRQPWLTAPPPNLAPAIRAEAALLAGRFALFTQRAEAAQADARAALAELPDDALFLRGLAWLNLGLAQRLTGDLSAAATALAEAAHYGRAADDASTFVSALIAQANVQQVQGDLSGAEHLFRQVAQSGSAPAALPLAELAPINLGWLYAEQNRLAEAVQWLEDGLALARRKRGQRGILDGSTFLALTRAMQGDRAGAEHALAEAQALADRLGPGVVSQIVAERRARTQLLLGDWSAAQSWALRVDPQQPPDELGEDVVLTVVRYNLAAGSATGAPQPIRAAWDGSIRLLDAAETSRRTDRRIRALVVHAVAADALHDAPTAFHSLQEALSLAAPGGYVRTFVNLGDAMRRLIERYIAAHRHRHDHPSVTSYAEQVLAAFGNSGQPTGGLEEPLTEREQEVLTLIAAGHSNAAIAEQLTVALTTVKAHLRNIFGKLEVGSRTQAVARARELGLIK